MSFHGHRAQSLSIRFTSDVGASISVSAITITDASGTVISPSLMALNYVAATKMPSGLSPGLRGGILPSGNYHFSLSAAAITDNAGRHLDGNKDGIGGDDFVWNKSFRSRG